jgi:hypothetical protein
MCAPKIKSTWLSTQMATALAAFFILNEVTVIQAADKLTEHAKPTHVISELLGLGVDLAVARGLVEALSAFRDLSDDIFPVLQRPRE